MTRSQINQARSNRTGNYAGGYDAGYRAALAGEPFARTPGASWSHNDGYCDGYEDGSALRHGQQMQEVGR